MPLQVKPHNISLRPEESAALRVLAAEKRHGFRSTVVAELIDTAMCDRYGTEWRQDIDRIAEGAGVGAA